MIVIENFTPDQCKALQPKVNKAKVLGKGGFAKVVEYENGTVLKVMDLKALSVAKALGVGSTVAKIQNEVNCMATLIGTGITADFQGAWRCDQVFYIQMGLIQNAMTLTEYLGSYPDKFLAPQLQIVLDKLTLMNISYGVLNNDLHLNNILVQFEPATHDFKDIFLIDFGQAHESRYVPPPDGVFLGLIGYYAPPPNDAFGLWFFLTHKLLGINLKAVYRVRIPRVELDAMFLKAYRKYPGYSDYSDAALFEYRDKVNKPRQILQIAQNSMIPFGAVYGGGVGLYMNKRKKAAEAAKKSPSKPKRSPAKQKKTPVKRKK